MTRKGKTPAYAIRLLSLLILAAVVFFGGLQLFVPEGSRLTGSYDAASLKYIAAAPVSYASSESCGNVSCHDALYKQWSEGAHGALENKSKCEVCHGPQGDHPSSKGKIAKVRGNDNVVDLCLSCHRQLKARLKTGQPQIVPAKHPYPHEGTLICTQCHNPHSPGINKPVSTAKNENAAGTADSSAVVKKTTEAVGESGGKVPSAGETLASGCFSCHGPSGQGGFAPVLAGQAYSVLKEKLMKIKSGEIDSPMMKPIASGIKDEDIDVLAKYFSGVN